MNAGVWILRLLAAWTIVSVPATAVLLGLLRRTGEDAELAAGHFSGVREVDAAPAVQALPGRARVA